MLSRRGLLTGLGAVIAAPAIVRVASLMKLPRMPFPYPPPNRTVRVWMDIEAIRDRNILLSLDDYAGLPTFAYRNIPMRVIW